MHMPDTDKIDQVFCESAAQWRAWLAKNHDNKRSIWLVFLKDRPSSESLTYETALDEALCFGWIDSTIKKLDQQKYVRKFAKRRKQSEWSDLNKSRISKLIKSRRMTPAGYEAIRIAKSNGSWNREARQPIVDEVPNELQVALEKDAVAKEYFEKLSPTNRIRYIMWIATAKRKETLEKRVREAMSLLQSKKPLGLK
jgi:uncharacterized protein YdeI (YjbR/CyaY-like superfamily)